MSVNIINKANLMAVKTALSIRQPWAWLIAHGHKKVENRTWDTRFRGWFYVHTGKKVDVEGYRFVMSNFDVQLPPIKDLQTGGIVAVAKVVDVVQRSYDPYFFGPHGFVLSGAEPVRFHPLRGQLGFFRVNLGENVVNNLLIRKN